MAAREQHAVAAPDFTLTVGGSSVPLDVRGMVTRILARDSVSTAGTFEFDLTNWDATEGRVRWSDDSLFDPGKPVQIQLGYIEALGTVMDGEITGLEVTFPETGAPLLTVRGYDRFHRLRRGRRTRSYLQVKDSDLASQIAGDLGLTPDVEATAEVHPYLLQMNQTDVDFLLTRARAVGYELSVDEKTLHFRKSRHDRGKVVSLGMTTGLLSFRAYLSTADQVSKVAVRSWDHKAKEPLVGQASSATGTMGGQKAGPAASQPFGTTTLTLVDVPVGTQNEADLLAQGVLDELALGYVIAEATAVGDPHLAAGTVVELGGLGQRFSGLYYIVEAAHVWDSRYVTHLELRRNAA
jgi:phage protein D